MVREPNRRLLSPHCPKCNICIEKNGGCNHMQCSKCKHDFCWMFWEIGRPMAASIIVISRYKENPHIVNQSQQAQARRPSKSTCSTLEVGKPQQELAAGGTDLPGIHEKFRTRVMNNRGHGSTGSTYRTLPSSWPRPIPCRYTLQYTYPFAYYMESGPRKKLELALLSKDIEYQQAQLEAEIENLSWKVERGTLDRGVSVCGPLGPSVADLENQMHIAEQRRRTLLKDFHDT
ncbi:E3 ubiquitin-protein ligase ARIH2 [Camelus dromedarius]|uniref:E3 ubiquitin-protein ligase ARIH2 n=1 Tax=Camelus dromedarius TaxID=9838 RepID=A0A5N4D0H8_CAMDR|nr:E3 ubiquitin-protein ligase ARIH2 [Camelus dromedarius]